MKLWEPSAERIAEANISRYLAWVKAKYAAPEEISAFYDWSVSNRDSFWESIWEFCRVTASKKSAEVYKPGENFRTGKWFPGARLNFARNLLSRRDQNTALIYWRESERVAEISYADLYRRVSSLARHWRSLGIKPGDRIAAVLPNCPEAVIGMLAASSLGAVWSSCSPDFGASGILDRFGQISPKILIYCDAYIFKGARLETTSKIKEISAALKNTEHFICLPLDPQSPDRRSPTDLIFHDLSSDKNPGELEFEELPFDHPLYIMFSSGTTGKPKCIVHGQGGTLIEHLKEHVLHTDLKESDVLFYQTTTGWMMWNWLVSGLSQGAALVLYDGAPFLDDGRILFRIAERERITIFGTNAKFIAALEKSGLRPKTEFNLESLKAVLSTGSPLLPEGFDYVYREIKSDVQLSSISGGTDILGCFALGCPILPVYRSELQMRSLGLKVQVYSENGQSIVGQKGELVCGAPFPSMPIGFYGDESGDKYESSYFKRFPGVWCHGDWVELTERGGMIFLGRSDTVLNPGGIRIGTAEIYRQVEKLSAVEDSVVVGQDWEGDVRVVLFVKLRSGENLSPALKKEISDLIRKEASPFHVPKFIIAVPDIPRTRSGKITELAVRDIINGLQPKNTEALANPEALNHFRNIPELRQSGS